MSPPVPGKRPRERRRCRAGRARAPRSPPRWRAIVASSPRATGPVRACSAPVGRPVLERGAGERDEQLAGDAGGGGEPLGGALERDEEVGGDRGGGVVGGAVVVGDLDRAHLQSARRAARRRASASAVEPAMAQPAPANGARAALRHRHQGVEAERFVPGAAAARVVAPEQWPTNCALRGVRAAAAVAISVVGHGQQHDVGAGVCSAAERALDLEAGLRERGGQGMAETAGADDGAAQGRGAGGVPVQFSHEIPAGEGAVLWSSRSIPWW